MKKFSYWLLVAVIGLGSGSCKQSDSSTPTYGNKQTVAVSVAIPGSVRASVDYTDILDNGAVAKVEKLHVYLTDEDGKIFASKEFLKSNEAEWKQITDPDAKKGYKFVNVDNSVRQAYVFANPQGTIGAEGSNIRQTPVFHTLPKVTDVVYASKERIATVGEGAFEDNSEIQDGNRVRIKRVRLTIAAAMNRFQITSAKFQKIVWKRVPGEEAMRIQAQEWKKKWINDHPGGDSAKAFVDYVGKYDFATGKYTKDEGKYWNDFFELQDITDQVYYVFMNRFYNDFVAYDKYVPTSSLLWAKHFMESFEEKTTSGSPFSFTAKYYPLKGGDGEKVDATDFALLQSEYIEEKYSTRFIIPEGKAVAFNFFPQAGIDYAKTAPSLHFVIGGVEEYNAFLNITGYTDAENGIEAATGIEGGGFLINLDLAKLNGGRGILVYMEEGIPIGIVPEGQGPKGADDIVPENFRLVVNAEFKPWISKNVYPAIDDEELIP